MTRTYANQWTTPYLTVSTVRGSQHIRRSSGIRASNYCVELNFTILCVRLTGCKPMEECILHLKELQSLHHKLLWNPFGCFPAHGSEFCTSEGSDNFSGVLLFSVQDQTFPKDVTLLCFGVVFAKMFDAVSSLNQVLDETKKLHWIKVQSMSTACACFCPLPPTKEFFRWTPAMHPCAKIGQLLGFCFLSSCHPLARATSLTKKGRASSS